MEYFLWVVAFVAAVGMGIVRLTFHIWGSDGGLVLQHLLYENIS